MILSGDDTSVDVDTTQLCYTQHMNSNSFTTHSTILLILYICCGCQDLVVSYHLHLCYTLYKINIANLQGVLKVII